MENEEEVLSCFLEMKWHIVYSKILSFQYSKIVRFWGFWKILAKLLI